MFCKKNHTQPFYCLIHIDQKSTRLFLYTLRPGFPEVLQIPQVKPRNHYIYSLVNELFQPSTTPIDQQPHNINDGYSSLPETSEFGCGVDVRI